jgi:glycosyltransferase involved in cell wall biosynthesis
VRVLFVSDVYFPRVNGVSTSIRTFRADLAGEGIESVLVAPAYTESWIDGSATTGGEEAGIVRIPSRGVPRDPEDRAMKLAALRRALHAAAVEDFDLVHVHTPFIAHYAGVRFARRAGIPVIATYHTFFEQYLHHYVPALPRRAGAWLARAFTRSQCGDVDALIAPSEPMRERLREYGVRTAIHVLPTGLPADRFRPGDGARFRAGHGLPPDAPLAICVGRVAHEKNLDFLLRMFVAVRRERPDALLLIAGEGPARLHLEREAAQLGLGDAVRFAGYLDRDTGLLDCYAAADVFVFASRTETQGLVLLEALAQGTPVVSTAALGTRSILKPGCGALVVEEHVGEFAAAVLRVLADRDLRARLGAEARPYAENWSSAAMGRRLAALYRHVQDAHASAGKAPGPGTTARVGR